MKIAVTAQDKTLEAKVDPRFGRAKYFVIVDETGTLCEAVDNSTGFNAMQGAGIQAAKVLADKDVKVLLTGFCGPNAFRTLQAAGIKVVAEQSGTVKEALQRFQDGSVTFCDEPNAEAHW